jgi:hypothetical protein
MLLSNYFKCDPPAEALQLHLPFQVSLVGFGLVAAAPDGPCDDESRLDPALG